MHFNRRLYWCITTPTAVGDPVGGNGNIPFFALVGVITNKGHEATEAIRLHKLSVITPTAAANTNSGTNISSGRKKWNASPQLLLVLLPTRIMKAIRLRKLRPCWRYHQHVYLIFWHLVLLPTKCVENLADIFMKCR
jgi:hypothetical protein